MFEGASYAAQILKNVNFAVHRSRISNSITPDNKRLPDDEVYYFRNLFFLDYYYGYLGLFIYLCQSLNDKREGVLHIILSGIVTELYKNGICSQRILRQPIPKAFEYKMHWSQKYCLLLALFIFNHFTTKCALGLRGSSTGGYPRLPLTHRYQIFSSGTSTPTWSNFHLNGLRDIQQKYNAWRIPEVYCIKPTFILYPICGLIFLFIVAVSTSVLFSFFLHSKIVRASRNTYLAI